MNIFVLFFFLIVTFEEWILKTEQLMQNNVNASNFQFNDQDGHTTKGGLDDIQKCVTNDITYMIVGNKQVSVHYSINYSEPHYQVKVLMDGYFLDSTAGLDSQVKFKSSGPQTSSYVLNYGDHNLQTYQQNCNPTWHQHFEVQTFSLIFSHTLEQFNLSVLTKDFTDQRNFGIRNFQIYINTCHPTCYTCKGSSENDCLTCKIYSQPILHLTTSGSCSSCQDQARYLQYWGCTIECDYNRIPDTNNVCQFSKCMISNIIDMQNVGYYFSSDLFTQIQPWFVIDPVDFPFYPKIFKIICLGYYDFVGPFIQNEGLQVNLQIPSNTQYIRFRINFYQIGTWTDYTTISIILDQIVQAQIQFINNNPQIKNADLLYQTTSTCSNVYRIETKLRTNQTISMLQIKGNLTSDNTQYCGFRDIQISVMRCANGCIKCDLDLTCHSCYYWLKLYKNTCVSTCPSHSIINTDNCIDFDEFVENSQYIIKAFYDSQNTKDTDVNDIVGIMTDGLQDFKTSDHFLGSPQVFFGYYYDLIPKRVLGGPMIWNKATFTKTFQSLNPHYKINIQFKLILGDNFEGDFQYTIDTQPFTLTTTSLGVQSTITNVGRSEPDKKLLVNETINHVLNSLTITLKCNSLKTIDENFCLLYDYFLISYQCTEYCDACNGPTWDDCTLKQLPTLMTSPTTCSDNTHYLDTSNTPAVCKNCPQPICQTCISTDVCTSCLSGFILVNGMCLCPPQTFQKNNTCVSCNQKCYLCYDSGDNNCLSCHDELNRVIKESMCVCKNNYEENTTTLSCEPIKIKAICGDLIVSEGEECDDGNDIQFDGCHHCKFDCQIECITCINGQCTECRDGYTFHPVMKSCYIEFEKNICQSFCTNFSNGIYYDCDNSLGYYYNQINQRCESICGDMIIAIDEMCDDGNIIPFDGCHYCLYSCDRFCLQCDFGICSYCQSGFQLIDQQCIPIHEQALITFCDFCQGSYCLICDQKCQIQCTKCLYGKCYQCNTEGWEYDNRTFICNPIYVYEIKQIVTLNYYMDFNYTEKVVIDHKLCQIQCLNCLQGNCLHCQQGYFINENTQICEQCHPLCKQCYYDKCLTCRDENAGLIKDTCICKDGYFETIYFQCLPCHDSCKTCERQSTNCLKCSTEAFLFDQINGYCHCQYGSYQINKDCLQCALPCQHCQNSADECVECFDSQAMLIENKCICPQGYYLSQQFTCEQCIQPCKTCITIAYNCLSCVSNLYQLLNGQCQCQNGYVEIDYECIKCQLPCIQCFNSIDHCQECLDDKQQLNQQYQCECFKGYIMNQQYKCELIPIIEIIDDQNQDNNQEISQINIELLQQSQLVCGDNSILYNNQCISQCGNGLLNQQYELCDDGNQIGGDGCSEICEIEEQFKCNNQQNQLSQCQFIQNLNFNLQLISQQKDQLQIVQLNFNQQIKLIQDIQLNDCISIIIIPQTSKYQLTYTSINQPNNLTYQNVIYQINVNFIEQVSNPLMQFNFTINNFINENDLQLKQLYKEITLGNPFILSQNTQAKINATIYMNQIMMYSMAGVACTSLLTGNFVTLFGMLDLLQQLSYLKYTSCEKPAHLTQFLELFSKITLKPLLDFMKIDDYLAKLNGGKLPFQKQTTTQSSVLSQVNSYYFINAKSCYITLIVSYAIYLFCYYLNYRQIYDKGINFILSKNYELEKKSKLYSFLYKGKKFLQQQKMMYFYTGLFQAFQSVEHQFLFSAFLQFPNYTFNSTLDSFNSLTAIFGLFLPISLTFIAISKAKIQNRNNLAWNYFFSGIKPNYWSVLQRPIKLIKVILYMGTIVGLSKHPVAQSYLLSFISAIYSVYIIYFRPFESNLENVKLIIRELSFLSATGSFMAYSYTLTDYQYNLFGWVHIGLFSFIMGSNLLIDLTKQIQTFYQDYLKSVKKELARKEQMYKFNKLQEFVAFRRPKKQGF